ncbi:enoyl-CoA hydratase/isomerase family protein [Microvirga antarctica]|uniref:enoyl-CoA hydratase/isomerase family protein n=1 Tax=Microvirga antarctica TaxID=2819233 RepID=UPI001B311259|nr:enoyl-CoA hydratase/isomerase family protein [Microvirga antarctica]
MGPFDLTYVRVDIADLVATVTMDNPPVNAQNDESQEELIFAFDCLSDRDDVRVIVLTGKGKVFCAGVDIKARAGKPWGEGMRRRNQRSARESYHTVRECTKPVIGAINGAALGAGLAIVASCDILLASENASLGLPEVTIGMMGGCRHAMQLFGRSKVRRMMLTGDRVDGRELLRLGVVEDCLPPEELLPTAIAMARRIAAYSPLATQLAKQSLNTIEQLSLRDGYRYEQDMTLQLGKSDDSREAMTAFREKRPPVFVGR